MVVFADATACGDAAFSFAPLGPSGEESFSTHAVTPGQVLHLAASFSARRRGCTSWHPRVRARRFREGLTCEAQAGLEAALGHLAGFIETSTRETADARR